MILEELVREFAENVAAQTDAIFQVGADPEDKHGDRYIAAFEKLRARGNKGREALRAPFRTPCVG